MDRKTSPASPRVEIPGEVRKPLPHFPGGRRGRTVLFTAKKLWKRVVTFVTRTLRSLWLYKKWNNPFKSNITNGRGRPTTPDNFLLGARNAWVLLLEESWPEVGYQLHAIRNKRTSIESDLRKALLPLEGKTNGSLARALIRDNSIASDSKTIRDNRILISELHDQIQAIDEHILTAERKCHEAGIAIESALGAVPEELELSFIDRYTSLIHFRKLRHKLDGDQRAIELALRDQEAGFEQSELLNYLLSERYAVEPLQISNALAGLPTMGWRQSHARCSKMIYDSEPHLNYRVVAIIGSILKELIVNGSKLSSTSFQRELAQLSPNHGFARNFLWTNWRYLRIAIEECGVLQLMESERPFSITKAFLDILASPKSPSDAVLAEREAIK